MSLGNGNAAIATDRRETMRDEVHYRARAFGPDARQLAFLVVNISPHGLMARCDTPFEVGDRIHVTLPTAGVVVAEVRWSLGGRLGAQFTHAIDLAAYYALIAVLLKSK